MSETMEELGISDLNLNESLINNLPNDCLKRIFSFLPIEERLEIEKVCKRWRNIGEEGWNDIKELTILRTDSDNMIYLFFKRCGRYLKKLIVDYFPLHPHSLSMAVEFCRLDQLEEIELLNLHFREEDIVRIIQNLREIFENSGKLVAVTMKGELHRCMLDYLILLNPETLRKLHLVDLTAGGLSINPDRFPNLKELYLNDIEIIEEKMIREEKSLKELERLILGRCEVPENFIRRIWTFTNLKELGLWHHWLKIKNEHIRHIARHCDKIKKMGLGNYIDPTNDCFEYLGEMRSLEILNFEMFSMDSYDLAYLTNIKKLSFRRCEGIAEGNGLIELIENSSTLEELELIKIRGLGRRFLDKVERVFQNGQRKKQLIVIIRGRNYKCLNGLGEITYHPLLKLKVDNDLEESENDFDEDDDDDDIS